MSSDFPVWLKKPLAACRPLRPKVSFRLSAILGSFLASLLVSVLAYGQATVATIIGTASDASGSVVPGVQVIVTNQGTNASRITMTDVFGNYEVNNLPPGTYTVTANLAHFRKVQTSNIVLTSQQTVRIDIPLSLGSNVTEISVSAIPVINSETPTIASTISSEALTDTATNLRSTAGTTGDSGVYNMINLLPSGYQSSGARWSMYGSRGSEAYFNVDGISVNSAAYGNYIGDAQPSFESIQEVHYNMVNNNAEYPQLVNVTTITKSGTNQYHGGLFWFNSNSAWNAVPYFSSSLGPDNKNDFGAFLGGPVIRNRFFFYGTYEGVRDDAPVTINPTVPTANMRSGDFSGLTNASTGKPLTITNPFTGKPFPNNAIPQSMFSAPALKWQQMMYPLPNWGNPDSPVANFRGKAFSEINRNDEFDVRGDYIASPVNSLYVRYSFNRSEPQQIEGGLPPNVLGYQYYLKVAHQGVISDTWILNSNLINVAKAGYTRATITHYGSTFGQSLINTLGLQGVPPAPPTARGIPTVSISGFTTPSEIADNIAPDQTIQFTDQMTYQRGRHTLKWGYEYRPQYFSQQINPSFGSYSFNGHWTGYAYSDFLLGLPSTTAYSYSRSSEYAHFWFMSGFLQDDFKVSRKLTLSYGLRYDYDSPPVDKYDAVANFNPATGSIVVSNLNVLTKYVNPRFPSQIPVQTAAEAGYPGRSLRVAWKKAFQPRFGFAFRPFTDANTVIRGGYGLFNDDLTADMFSPMYGGPFGLNLGYTNQISKGVPLLTFTQPFIGSSGTVGAVSITGLDRKLRNPYVQQWNLTVERNLGWQTGLRLSYVGTKTTQLIYERDLNQVSASTTPFAQSRTRYPFFQHTYLFSNGAVQSYNAATAEINHNWKKGISFNGAFTWAKSLTDADETSDVEGGPLSEDAYDLRRNYGNSEYSARRRFVSGAVWELPFGKGKALLNDRPILDEIAGGWKISGSYIAQSGLYYTPAYSGYDPANVNQFSGRPDRVGDPTPVGHRSISNWFNPKAFAIPQSGTFGNAAYGSIEGPGAQIVNAAVFKTFALFRENTLRLQISATNALNHPNFAGPGLTITSTSVGHITSIQTGSFAGPRTMLVGARYNF